MKRRIGKGFLITLLSCGVYTHAEAFLRLRSPLHGVISWDSLSSFQYNIYELEGFKNITHETFLQVLKTQYAYWAQASQAQLDFSYVGLTTAEITYIQNHHAMPEDTDGIHTHRVIGRQWNKRVGISATAIAITLMYAEKDQVIDADIVYNDDRYSFCVETCGPRQLHLPSIVLHEMGHQIGFDHSRQAKSIMAATLSSGIKRTLQATDEQGALCTYGKGTTSSEEYAHACSFAENEGGLGGSPTYLSSESNTNGCGSIHSYSTQSPPKTMSVLMVLLGIFIIRKRWQFSL